MQGIRSKTKKDINTLNFFISGMWVFLLLGSIILFQGNANAAQITLAWDASDGAVGYKIYSGTTSNSYQWFIDVGNAASYTTSDLTEGYTYYFAATAYDESGLESDYSEEVSYNANTDSCSYSISPSSASFNSAGGTGTISVTTQSGCPWTAMTGVTWVTITSGSSGTGSGIVSYTVSSNSGSSRATASTIVGQLFTFSQNGTQTYTISATAGPGGIISPSGSSSVNYGSSQTYTITPNSGYIVGNVTVDGASVGAVSSYTFSNITAPHTISATFTAITYTLSTFTTGTGSGTIKTNPTGTNYSTGTVVILTATADASSTFTGWSGACSGTATTCQVTMNSNTSVSASFTLNTLKIITISATAGPGGTISPSGNVSVNYGSSQTYTITPKSGYSIKKVIVDGVSVGKVSSYTFSIVNTRHTIKAMFGK